MLTRWKHSRTSFESAPKNNNGAAKRKKNSKDSTSIEHIGISFVKPIARQNPFYIQRIKASKSSSKKRRKAGLGAIATDVDEDLDPILCLTSSHRVAILGRSSAASKDITTLTESKSRNYVSRPGVATSFDVASASTLEGVAPLGVQYDPASNFLYAIRNGSELAIWSAASSSIIQGPDQSMDVKDATVDDVIKNSKKRKLEDSSTTSFDRALSQNLAFPEGKTAVTLTPFYFSDQQDDERLAAVGASGCCDDGSIWIAIRRDISSSFELLIVDGSSMGEAETGKKTDKRKSTPAKSKKNIGDAANSWKLLGSKASRSSQKGKDLMVKVQSVLMSKDNGSIVLRQHSIKVSLEGGKEQSCIEKSVKQSILNVANKEEVYTKLDTFGNSLSIAHKNESGGWMLASVHASTDGEDIACSASSIPLTEESEKDASLFSFGCLGQNVYAVLSKVNASTSVRSTLRIVDTQRKVELLKLSWREGVMGEEAVTSTDDALTRFLHDKHCRAMITNELDGSLVLVTSTSSGAIGVVSSTINTDLGAGSLLNDEPRSNTSSLASALRAAAVSEAFASNQSAAAVNVSRAISDGTYGEEDSASQKKLDAAIDSACQELSQSAEMVLDFIDGLGGEKKASNGKAGEKTGVKEPVNWRTAFYDGMNAMQCEINPDAASAAVNGLKNGMKGKQKRPIHSVKDQPKRYVVSAFRHTTSIFLSIHQKSKTLSGDDSVVLEMIRQEAMRVLSRILHSECLQSRTDCDIELTEDSNALIHLLKGCPSVLLQNETLSPKATDKQRVIGALDILDGMIYHVKDLPERLLVCVVRFLLRNVALYDVISYYTKGSSSGIKKSLKGSNLATKLQQLSCESAEEQINRIENKLIAEAVLDFTSKIVVYSKCNLSLLSKSLRDILTATEVETLLVTLSKLLKAGDSTSEKERRTDHPTLYTGVIDWISSLTDAHTSTILKMSDEGSLVVDRIQSDLRSAVQQTQAANELMELSGRVADSFIEQRTKKICTASTQNAKAKETTAIAAYTIERLVF